MSIATRLSLTAVGVLLLVYGAFASHQSIWILTGVIRKAWIVKISVGSWIITIASLAIPFLAAFLLWRLWSFDRTERRIG